MIAPPKPPAHDELEALIKEARERQLRRRLLGAAGVAIAAAIGLGAYALLPADSTHGTAGGSPNPGAAAPLCRSSQFSSKAGLNGAVGTLNGTVLLTNTSGDACSFPRGRPHVTVLWNGHILPTREFASQETRMPPLPVLAPRSTAAIDMDWSNWCGKPKQGKLIDPTFRFNWPGRLEIDVPNGVSGQPRCDGKGSPSVLSVGRPYRNKLLAP